MWIENKGEEFNTAVAGPARIGRVTTSKSGKSFYYRGQLYQSLKGRGNFSNYINVETQECFWISGCRKDGRDALYNTDVQIDPDVQYEYWTQIRNQPQNAHIASYRANGKY